MQLSELKTVHVTGLEWNDTVNGNSYFALEIALNLDASRGEPKTLIKNSFAVWLRRSVYLRS